MDFGGTEFRADLWNFHPWNPRSYDELPASRVVCLTKRPDVLCKPRPPTDRSRVQDVFVENNDANAVGFGDAWVVMKPQISSVPNDAHYVATV
jgi:hypothetical protein